MNRLNNVLENILPEISLSKEEMAFLMFRTKNLLKKIKKNLKNERILIGGSLAKGTIIKKDEQDIDFFIIFKDENSVAGLKDILKKSKINAKKIYGSRDYFRLIEKNLTFEFIPIVEIVSKGKVKNVTDFSPLHVKYIRKKADKKILDEIKLAKAFCIAREIYGAESYIHGFSGYALELMICYYGSFAKFLTGIQKDRFMDIERGFKNEKEALREINQSKLLSPIILIDPTNKYRNVCAGLSYESFEKLRTSAKKFLKKPSENFFKKIEFDLDSQIRASKKEGLEIYYVETNTDRENKDIAGTKMKKFFKFLIKELEMKKQIVKFSKFLYDGGKTAKAYLAIEEKKNIEVRGPKKDMKKAIKNFKTARKKIYFSKGFACAKEEFKIDQFFGAKQEIAKSMGVDFSWKKI